MISSWVKKEDMTVTLVTSLGSSDGQKLSGPNFNFAQLDFPVGPQGILAEYLLEDYEHPTLQMFHFSVRDYLFSQLYDRYVNNPSIRHCIVWNSEISDLSGDTDDARRLAVSTSLKAQKARDLTRIVETFVGKYQGNLTPVSEGDVWQKIANLTPIQLGEKVGLVALLLIKKVSRPQISYLRNQPLGSKNIFLQNNARARSQIEAPLIRELTPPRLSADGTLSPIRTEMIARLSIKLIREALYQPLIYFDLLEFPQEIPKELPDLPIAQPLQAPVAPVQPPPLPPGPPPGRLTLVGRRIVQIVKDYGTPVAMAVVMGAAFHRIGDKGLLPIIPSIAARYAALDATLLTGVIATIATLVAFLFSAFLVIALPPVAALAMTFAITSAGWVVLTGISVSKSIVATTAIFAAAFGSVIFVRQTKFLLKRLYQRLRA
jgi:hypothetical protein